MTVTESPWRAARDSPSRQLLWELSRLAITAQEDLYERLEQDSQKREAAHKTALAEAIAKHEKVRKDAEAERDRLERQIQQENQRRVAEARQEIARQEVDRQRQATVERELAEKRLKAERAEAERVATEERNAELARQKAEKDRQAAEAIRLKEAREAAEARRKADKEARTKAEAAAAQKAHVDPPTPQSAGVSKVQGKSADPHREAEHRRYLDIHKSLKELRISMAQQAKRDAKLKARMGDMRRDIKKSVGQIVDIKGKNMEAQKRILGILKEAIKDFPQPTVSLSAFTARPIEAIQVSSCFIYMLNQFAKAVVAQFINEAAVFSKVADPVGTMAMSIFAKDEFRINGMSLVDILVAKYHVVCPPLFGIYGPENTDEGRTRLGWWREEPGGPWISEQSHQDRMNGLGLGYAALSLRNFENSRMSNPYPPYHFWRALSAVLNVPAGQITETHSILLRALLLKSESRFLDFFGDAAKKLLYTAVVEYPKRAEKGSVAAEVLLTLGETLKKDKKLCW
ncbi:MAG: hypothetical protein Q9219_005616 [cf. Caloplaca sp. 3 TL-2023]